MIGLASSKCLVLGTSCRFVGNQVGPSTGNSRRTNRLVCIDHQLVLGSLFQSILVVIDQPLAVVVFSARKDIPHIAAFHGWIPVLIHKLVSLIHVALVVACGGGGLVMHDHLHSFFLGISTDSGQIKIRVWGQKVKYIVFGIPKPILPAHIPSFHQYPIKAMLCGKINVLLHVGRSRPVCTIRLGLAVIGKAQFDCFEIIRVRPRTFACDHLPPDSYILHGLDPRSVFDFRRLIQVIRDSGCKDICRLIAYDDGSPRALRWCIQVPFIALCIGGQVCREDKLPIIQLQVKGRIVNQGRLMQVDVQSIRRLEHQRRLHTGI